MTGFAAVLAPGEATITRARICARRLACRLVTAPVDRDLYAEVQQLLDDVAFRACDELEELAGSENPVLRRRLYLLLRIPGEEER